jgi:hypothetical protein
MDAIKKHQHDDNLPHPLHDIGPGVWKGPPLKRWLEFTSWENRPDKTKRWTGCQIRSSKQGLDSLLDAGLLGTKVRHDSRFYHQVA